MPSTLTKSLPARVMSSSSPSPPPSVKLSGPLDVAALRRSLNGIVSRHESFRTTLTVEDGRPVQPIAPGEPIRFHASGSDDVGVESVSVVYRLVGDDALGRLVLYDDGFHEDGIQAGLAVAEKLGAVKRPWVVPNPSTRVGLSTEGMPLGQCEAPSGDEPDVGPAGVCSAPASTTHRFSIGGDGQKNIGCITVRSICCWISMNWMPCTGN